MDILVFAMVCIALVRFVGFLALVDFAIRLRDRIHVWIAVGWLIYALSPVFGLLAHLDPRPVYDFLYLSMALEGMLLLTSGAIWLYRKFRLEQVAANALLLFVFMLVIFILGGRTLLGFLVPVIQFLLLAGVLVVTMLGGRTFNRLGGSSIYWLQGIFLAGALQALAFIVVPTAQLPATIYIVTVGMSTLILIFFMSLQHNLSLKRQQESDALYRLIVENQTDLIVKTDMDGRCLYVNPRYSDMFGLPQEKLLGKPITRRIHADPEEEQAQKAARQRLLVEPYTCYVEERTETVHGPRWLAWSEKTVFDENHVMTAVVAVGRDISEQKQVAAQVRRLNLELEQRVKERTAQLETLNRELESFTYSVSHDLKAPLRGIEGFSKILEIEFSEKLGGEGRHYLENVTSSVRHMRALIDDLLAYSRLERRALNRQRILLVELVNELLAEHNLELEQSHARVEINLADCVIEADRENLRQALGNLLDNAIKYSRNAEPPHIEVGHELQPHRLRLWVKDNGIGFDMANKNRIFELFQRLHGQDEFAGTGVGLAIVQKAVQRMDGSISVDSAPGQGSTFTLEFPR